MRLFFLFLISIVFSQLSCVKAQQYAQNQDETPTPVNYYHEINVVSEKLKSNPSNAELLNERSMLYLRVNEFEKAIEDIDKAIGIDARNAGYKYTKALIFLQRGRLDASMEVINEAIVIEPKNESFYFFRARLYSMKEEYRKAIGDIDHLLTLNPKCDYCYLQKAIWFKKLNMFYEEIRNYLFYLELTEDESNKILVERRLKTIRKSDKYFNDLYKAAKKDIRKNGYPWEYKLWNQN